MLIDTANHNFETGTYNLHIYAIDKRSISKCVARTSVMVENSGTVKFSAEMAPNGADVDIVGTGIREVRNVQAAIWGKENGQNDIVWYNMPRIIGTKYQIRINIYDHLEAGTYYCHLYVTEMDGSLHKAGQTEFEAGRLHSNYLRISDFDNRNGRCRARLYLPEASMKIAGLQMAVWTENNGQDDIEWYHASLVNGIWSVNINSLNHKGESGDYNIHVYARGTDGTMECLAKDVFYMTRSSWIDVYNVIFNAGKPLGKTLYVWGGGWNAADNGAGETATAIGLWPDWENYFNNNRQGYSFYPGKSAWDRGERQWRFWGLDCSGYLGWIVYNTVQEGRNEAGYVTDASRLADSLAGYGYGTAASCSPDSVFRPGDIISTSGHCYLCLGQCSDGSVLLLHSTPNGGVQVSGTVNGGTSSQASTLAQTYMQHNYPQWWASFGNEGKQSVNASVYLNGRKFSWSINDQIGDVEGLQAKSADEVLRYLK